LTSNDPSSTDLKQETERLETELGFLQRRLQELKVPTILVVEGMDAAGKGSLINKLLLSLDPRGFKVYSTHAPSEEAVHRPFLWRFWRETPAKGRITIFDRSWYRYVLHDTVERRIKGDALEKAYEDINHFEKNLHDDGMVLIKVFLSISKKKQRQRFEALQSQKSTAWRVTDKDWKHHGQFDLYRKAIRGMQNHTHTEYAPWHVVKSHKHRHAYQEVLQLVVDYLRAAVAHAEKPKPSKTKRIWPPAKLRGLPSILDQVDLSVKLESEEYRKRRRELQERIYHLEHQIYEHRIPVVLAFCGWDAAGKGGAIRRLVKGLDPRGYEVIPVAAPNDIEISHHYLWRFWTQFPKGGHIAIYDRSWYGRVLVERVEGFASEEEWQRAYEEINQMEAHWSRFGTVILKFWVHISPEEQLARFEARLQNPDKAWKITDEDWRNRDKWPQYHAAVEDMIRLTDKKHAPWIVVPGNDKPYARIQVLESVVHALESRL